MNILLVDDEPLFRENLSEFLTYQLGHIVTQCDNGRDALELFKKTPFPMVLTDIRMPGMDGIELLRSLKALPQGRVSDIVVMTAYRDIDTANQALREDAYDFLHKPLNIEELTAVINRIAQRQSSHENY
jgi:two-component system response regulator AtoC